MAGQATREERVNAGDVVDGATDIASAPRGSGGSFLDGIDDGLVLLAVIVGIVVFGVLFWWLLLPLLLLVVDLFVVMLLLALTIPLRVLLRRPWRVEAVTVDANGTEESFTADVIGWRRALAMRDDIAEKLGAGYPAPVVGTLHRGNSTVDDAPPATTS